MTGKPRLGRIRYDLIDKMLAGTLVRWLKPRVVKSSLRLGLFCPSGAWVLLTRGCYNGDDTENKTEDDDSDGSRSTGD
jgi:hypothetical protein